jgi:Lrp/AsnC family leucine-responsive transcriptional regulator
MFDEIDRRILSLLQRDGRITNADIARAVEMAPSAVLERVRKLEERRVIEGYHAKLSPRTVAKGLLAFVLVRTDSGWQAETAQRLAGLADVQEVHHIAGEDCFLIKVRTTDTSTLGAMIRDQVSTPPNVRSTRTTIVLDTAKETLAVDLSDLVVKE